jgi:hypothetical protein
LPFWIVKITLVQCFCLRNEPGLSFPVLLLLLPPCLVSSRPAAFRSGPRSHFLAGAVLLRFGTWGTCLSPTSFIFTRLFIFFLRRCSCQSLQISSSYEAVRHNLMASSTLNF